MADPTQQPGRWTRRRWTRGLALGLGGLGGLGLAGCATAPASDAPAPEPPPGLDFGPPREPPDGAAALRPSPAMLDHVDRVLRPASHRDGAEIGRAHV